MDFRQGRRPKKTKGRRGSFPGPQIKVISSRTVRVSTSSCDIFFATKEKNVPPKKATGSPKKTPKWRDSSYEGGGDLNYQGNSHFQAV